MNLHILPTRPAGAAENMAIDFLMLRRYPREAVARFRHYAWQRPAFTFGYAQKIAFVRAQLPPGGSFELCRRPTGGGLVDHREDWTYALVIPRGHRLEALRAAHSYRAVHHALLEALQAQGVEGRLSDTEAESAEPAGTGVCFQRAEIHDVVHARTQQKIAGAAQKRTKDGLLFQGSIWRPAATAGGAIDWERFEEEFTQRLAVALEVTAEPVAWPEFAEHEVEGLLEQYSAPGWLEQR